MIEAYKKYWKGYVDFKGRTTRKDFWLAILAIFLVSFVLGIVIGLVFPGSVQTVTTEFGVSTKITGIPGVFVSIFSLAHFLPSIAMEIRRMHDINKSGWWLFIVCIPVIGWIWLLVLYCTASVNEGNKYN